MTQTLPNLEGAACATRLGRLLFADVTDDVVDACREVCASCPVRRRCLQWAVVHEHEGMWGGLSAKELEAERRRTKTRRTEPPTVSMWALLQQAAAAKRAGAPA